MTEIGPGFCLQEKNTMMRNKEKMKVRMSIYPTGLNFLSDEDPNMYNPGQLRFALLRKLR